jgi:RNA polymerase sigma-70 factor (ECF subfamily)
VSEADDRQLAEEVIRRRDESAFRRLYRRHSPALYLFALRLSGGDESRAEEMVQGTWIRALEGLPAFAWRSTLRTWLCGIAVNYGREQVGAQHAQTGRGSGRGGAEGRGGDRGR